MKNIWSQTLLHCCEPSVTIKANRIPATGNLKICTSWWLMVQHSMFRLSEDDLLSPNKYTNPQAKFQWMFVTDNPALWPFRPETESAGGVSRLTFSIPVNKRYQQPVDIWHRKGHFKKLRRRGGDTSAWGRLSRSGGVLYFLRPYLLH